MNGKVDGLWVDYIIDLEFVACFGRLLSPETEVDLRQFLAFDERIPLVVVSQKRRLANHLDVDILAQDGRHARLLEYLVQMSQVHARDLVVSMLVVEAVASLQIAQLSRYDRYSYICIFSSIIEY